MSENQYHRRPRTADDFAFVERCATAVTRARARIAEGEDPARCPEDWGIIDGGADHIAIRPVPRGDRS